MSTDEITAWLNDLKAGDAIAAERIWQAYFEKLARLIRKRLGPVALRVSDEEDIALSALNSFYDGVQAGRFPRLDDSDDLWKVLMVIACRKTNAFRDRHFAQKRGGGELRGESVFEARPGSESGPGIQQALGREPTPELAAAVAETIETLLKRLIDPELQSIASYKMDGYTHEEIAVKLGCTTRTIERKLEKIRMLWGDE